MAEVVKVRNVHRMSMAERDALLPDARRELDEYHERRLFDEIEAHVKTKRGVLRLPTFRFYWRSFVADPSQRVLIGSESPDTWELAVFGEAELP